MNCYTLVWEFGNTVKFTLSTTGILSLSKWKNYYYKLFSSSIGSIILNVSYNERVPWSNDVEKSIKNVENVNFFGHWQYEQYNNWINMQMYCIQLLERKGNSLNMFICNIM